MFKIFGRYGFIFFALILFDFLTKRLILGFDIPYRKSYGFGGFWEDSSWSGLTFHSLIFLFGVIFLSRTNRPGFRLPPILPFFAAGSLGNLLDRFSWGYTIDFIDPGKIIFGRGRTPWLVNIADLYIFISIVWLAVWVFYEHRNNIRR